MTGTETDSPLEGLKYHIIEPTTGRQRYCWFKFFRGGNLYYETETGVLFEIPAEDTGSGDFKSLHKAVELMRWIRKHLELRP